VEKLVKWAAEMSPSPEGGEGGRSALISEGTPELIRNYQERSEW